MPGYHVLYVYCLPTLVLLAEAVCPLNRNRRLGLGFDIQNRRETRLNDLSRAGEWITSFNGTGTHFSRICRQTVERRSLFGPRFTFCVCFIF